VAVDERSDGIPKWADRTMVICQQADARSEFDETVRYIHRFLVKEPPFDVSASFTLGSTCID